MASEPLETDFQEEILYKFSFPFSIPFLLFLVLNDLFGRL